MEKLQFSVVKLSSELEDLCRSLTFPITSGPVNFGTSASGDIPSIPLATPALVSSTVPLVVSSQSQFTYSDALTLVTKTISDSERRKSNIIVSGLPESTEPITDKLKINELCSPNLISTLRLISSLLSD